jgi:TP901 family phage tail tape measure protein
MSNIGYSTLSVLPGMAGFGAKLTAGVVPEMAVAGKASGAAFSKGMIAGLVAIPAALAAVALGSLKMASDFQASTTLLVTGAGESEKAIGGVRDGMLAMAGSVGTTPAELSKGMYLIESAGYHAATGLSVLHAAAEGAKVGAADLRVVADGLTTAMTDYHFPASQAADVTSKLIATVGAGKTTLGDLSGAMANVLPFAAALGIGFDNVLGAMATMTSRGIGAAQASTMLKFTIMSLSNETPKGVKALKSIGISTQHLTDDLKNKGLSGTLAEITDALGKKFPKGSAAYNHALAAIVGGTRGMGATLALTGDNAKTFTDNIKTISGATAEAGGHVKGFALTEETLAEKMDKAKASVAAMAIKLGNDLLPAGMAVMDFFNNTAVPALKNFGTFIMDTVVPAVQTFFTFLSGNEAKKGAGRFTDMALAGAWLKDILGKILPPVQTFFTFLTGNSANKGAGKFTDVANAALSIRDALSKVKDFITGTALPALGNIYTWITGTGIPALSNFKDGIIENRDKLKILAEFIGVVLLPVFANMAVKAVASAATQVTAWISAQVAGGTSALAQLGSHYIIVGGWVMSAAAAVASGATTAVIWAMYATEAIAGAVATELAVGRIAVAWAISSASAVASSAVSAAAWVASGARTLAIIAEIIAGMVAQKVATVVSMAISSAAVVGGWILMGATATASGIAMAAAWVVGLGPVAWVIAGIAALIAIIVVIATKTTWFQTIWEYTTGAIGAAWRMLWNVILAPIFRFILDGFGSIIGGISNVLLAMGHLPHMQWATDAGNAMKGAAAQAHALANGITDIPDHKTVTIALKLTGGHAVAAGLGGSGGLTFASGGVVPGTGYGDTQPAMLTPQEFVVKRDGSNLGEALKHFGAKAVTPVAGIDYDRLGEAVARAIAKRPNILDGKVMAVSVDQRLAPR